MSFPNPWDIPDDFAERFAYPDEMMEQITDPEPLLDAIYGNYPNFEW